MQDNPFQRVNQMPNLPELKMNLRWLVIGMLVFFGINGIRQCFFQIEPDEVGVIQRFGGFNRTYTPGLHFKIPFGIEKLTRVQVTVPFRLEFGFQKEENTARETRVLFGNSRSQSSFSQRQQSNRLFNEKVGFDRGAGSETYLAESLMLTGDLNFADVTWTIQYKIEDPVAYLFNVKNVEETIRNMAESVMRDMVGDSSIDEVITFGKQDVQDRAHKELQRVLNQFGCGINITQLVFQDVNPPEPVKESFERVNQSEQKKNKEINIAWTSYNDVIPKTRGEAKQIIHEADAYAVKRVNNARGAADRFLQTWEAYSKAKDVTRRRLYLEAMNEVLPEIETKTIVDGDLKGVLPLLQLDGGAHE